MAVIVRGNVREWCGNCVGKWTISPRLKASRIAPGFSEARANYERCVSRRHVQSLRENLSRPPDPRPRVEFRALLVLLQRLSRRDSENASFSRSFLTTARRGEKFRKRGMCISRGRRRNAELNATSKQIKHLRRGIEKSRRAAEIDIRDSLRNVERD